MLHALKKMLVALVLAAAAAAPAAAQSPPNPPFYYGFVPTAGQWNQFFQAKQDYLGFTPLNPSSIVASAPISTSFSGGVLTIGCPTCNVIPAASIRTKLPSTSFFVNDIQGNDANACTSPGAGACKTGNGAIAVLSSFDMGGLVPTVTFAAPAVSYPAIACLKPWVGGATTNGGLTPTANGQVLFVGDTTTPTNVLVDGGASIAVDVQNGCDIALQGFSVASTSTRSVQALLGGRILMSKMDLGAAGAGSSVVYAAQNAARIEINDAIGATTIHTGTTAAHLLQGSHTGEVRITCTTACLSFTADVTYTNFMLLSDHGEIVGTPSASFATNGHTVTASQYTAFDFGGIQWNAFAPPLSADIPGTACSGLYNLSSQTVGPTVEMSKSSDCSGSLLMIGGLNGAAINNQANTVNNFFISDAGAVTWRPSAYGTGALSVTSGVMSAGTLPATDGGTGFASFAVGDLLYADTTTTLARLADVATTNVLTSGGVGVAPLWGKVTLTALATQVANTVVGNATSGVAAPTALAMPSCSTASSALNWTTNTGFGCNTSITAAAVPVGGITGLGTGVATALGVNVGTAGSFVVNGGALGSPSSAGTIPAFTLGGTVSGGGNQINNVIIGTTTPLAGSFTTLTASTSLTSPLHIGGSGTTGTQLTFQTTTGNGTTDAFAWTRGNNGATTAMTLNNTGLGINTTSPQFNLTVNGNATAGVTGIGASTNGAIQIVGANSQVPTLEMDSFAQQSIVRGGRADGTAASPSTIGAANEAIYSNFAYGYNGSAYVAVGGFQIFSSQAYSVGNVGSYMTFGTSVNGSANFIEQMRLQNSGGLSVGTTTDPGAGVVLANNGFQVATAAKTLILKQGANGAVGTFVCTGGGTITISNTNFATSDAVIISMATAGGTITTPPAMKTVTGSTGFTVLCGATDTSTYNYALVKNAA